MKPKILSVSHYTVDATKQVVLLCTDGPRVNTSLTPAEALQFWKAHGVDTDDWLPAAQLLSTPDRAELEGLRSEVIALRAANKRALDNANAQCAAKHKALEEVAVLQVFNDQLRTELALANVEATSVRKRNATQEETIKAMQGEIEKLKEACKPAQLHEIRLRRALESANQALDQSNAQLASIKAIVCK